MAETYKKLAQGQLVVTAGTEAQKLLYEVATSPSTTTIIKNMKFVNLGAASNTIKLYHDGVAVGNVILPATNVAAGGYAEYEGTILLEPGDKLNGEASTAAEVTYTIYGLELT
jgi:hypothetical protein